MKLYPVTMSRVDDTSEKLAQTRFPFSIFQKQMSLFTAYSRTLHNTRPTYVLILTLYTSNLM